MLENGDAMTCGDQPEAPERDQQTGRFQPGRSGNPGGRPTRDHVAKRLSGSRASDALRVLVETLRGEPAVIIIDAAAIADLWQGETWRRGDPDAGADGDEGADDPDDLTGDPACWPWIKRRAIEDEAEGRRDRAIMSQVGADGYRVRVLSNGDLQTWNQWRAERGLLVRAELVERFGSWPALTVPG